MYLTGEFSRSVDSKLRLTLPADWRQSFSEGQVCLVPLPEAVYGFSPETHRAWMDSRFPGGYDSTNKKHVKLRRYLAAITQTVDIDKVGRLSLGKLSEDALAKCQIKRDVVVIGNVDHFEVWDAGEYRAQIEEIDDDELDALLYGGM